jgi:hypothetical protein
MILCILLTILLMLGIYAFVRIILLCNEGESILKELSKFKNKVEDMG